MPDSDHQIQVARTGETIHLQFVFGEDSAWAQINAEGAAILGKKLIEMSCEARGLTGPLFIIEPDS